MPIIWGWEYGGRANMTEIKQRWYPLVKGEADFFACWLQYVHVRPHTTRADVLAC